MKICKYGITLKRIAKEDQEMLRQWRNSETVNRYMEFREHITTEMQMKWFESVDNYNNFYYIIYHKNEPVGLINLKDIDHEGDGAAESGLFIANEKYRGTHIPLLASLMIIEIDFTILGGKESYIRTLRDNKTAIAYNKSLGYQLCEGQEEIENQKYVLTPQRFEEKTGKIRKAAARLTKGEYANGFVLLENKDFESGIAQKLVNLMNSTPLSVDARTKTVADGLLIYY